MLFLLRPRETWMPYALPRDPAQQDAHRAELRTAYDSTRKVETAAPVAEPPAPPDVIAQLKSLAELHASGSLTDDEFAAAKSRVLAASS